MNTYFPRIASAFGAVLSTVVLTIIASAPAATAVGALPGVTS